jgi:cytochrome c oxidase subunit II
MFRYLPSPDSEFAPVIDNLNYLILDISLFFTLAIVGTMIFFAVKYRKRGDSDNHTPHIEGSTLLEIIWTVVPTLVCILIAVYGYQGFAMLREAPKDALEINVIGKKWNWTFEYSNGKVNADEFVVPVGKPIKLIITSRDVLHSFFVPGMRTKVDAVPGAYSYQWFKPVKTGPQQVFCTEYCGDQHSAMLATMHVVSEAEYNRWINAKEEVKSPLEKGQEIYAQQACKTCHSLDGSRLVGPSFLNLYGREAKFASGEAYKADENYIKESILYPNKNIVEGYPAQVMPAFENILKDEDISNLIAFIKAQKGEANKVEATKPVASTKDMTPLERGKVIYETKLCIGCHSLDGSAMVGPSWKGLYGKKGKFVDGKEYTADDAYLKESILQPQKTVVEGYPQPSPMPAYEGQLSDQDLSDVIEYIKSLK